MKVSLRVSIKLAALAAQACLGTILSAAFLLAISSVPAASEIRIRNADKSVGIQGSYSLDEMPHVIISGVIFDGMEEEFKAAIELVASVTPQRTMGGNPQPFVMLSSTGGDVFTAIRIGEIVRAKGALTYVLPGSDCSSACVLIFAAGVDRIVASGGRLGLHRPAFADFERFARLDQEAAAEAYNDVLKMIRGYFATMGIASEFSDRFLSVSSSDINFIEEDEAIRLGISGRDPVFYEWDRARFRSNVSEAEYEKWIEFENCANSCSTYECQMKCSRE